MSFAFISSLFITIASLWFIRESRALLFWLYLWQLKDYHFGRFLAHFQTEKGKKIFSSPLLIFKVILVLFGLFLIYLPNLFSFHLYIRLIWIFIFSLLILVISYLFELFKLLNDLFKKNIKKPVLTQKALLIVLISLACEILFLYILFRQFYFILFPNLLYFSLFLVLFDASTPLVALIIVFLVHPFSVLFFRNPIIRKAKQKREKFRNLLVIAITGSFGKTSTKEFLYEILSKKFKVLKTKEHQNSEVGVSQCVLNDLKEEHEVFICEMGAYNRGGIKLLCDIVKPKIGIVTGVNEQHLATFGSMENLLSAEGGKELIESLPNDGMAFFNARNKYCQELYQKTPNQSLRHGTGQAKIKKFLYGENVKSPGMENIEGAKMVARELGMSENEIAEAAEKIKDRFPGIEIKKGINGLIIIDATYSANPDGVIAHLEYLKTLGLNKKVIVMPCLIELGKASKEIHLKIGKKIAETCDLAIITTMDRFLELKKSGGNKVIFLENPNQIFEKIKSFCVQGDVILLESRVLDELIKKLII